MYYAITIMSSKMV